MRLKSVFPACLVAAALAGTAMGQSRRARQDGAPAEGAKIPAVSAQTPDGKSTVELDKPTKHTVLVFGSYT